MKNLFFAIVFAAVLAAGAFGQEAGEKRKPTEADKTAAIPSSGYLKRGEPIGGAKKVSLARVMADPAKFAGKTVIVEGVVVRSCKTEGCWAEVAPTADAKSVRVKMKDHSFFIPLQSAGSYARVQGTVQVKTLTKEQVDHMIEEDGAKFDKINPDGTVTEVSFEATGIELTARKKSY